MFSDAAPSKKRWTLRELIASDQQFLWEMEYLALWDPPGQRRPRSVLENPAVRRLVENWGRAEDYGLVAIDEKTLCRVGAIWTRLDRYDALEDYGCPYPVLGIAVLEEHQELGIGQMLMEAFIKNLKPRIQGLRLGVHPQNSRARHLYEKFGFCEYAIGAGDYPQMKLDFP